MFENVISIEWLESFADEHDAPSFAVTPNDLKRAAQVHENAVVKGSQVAAAHIAARVKTAQANN